MKNLELEFIQRLKLINLCEIQEGPLGKTAPFMRILDVIRFTDSEIPQIIKTQISDNIISYAPPNNEFGKILVGFETTDAKVLVELLESWPRFTTADHTWADPLIKLLKE
jgi:hypothetical protein